ncbi:MAG: hypothetical protein QMD13_10365, partial [Candidatus Bathyarchaeia archaeon]|nr:hypothetical protein [Candidatus Bathyarchaeia archaeon]
RTMTGWLKKALTRKIARKGFRGKEQIIVIPPSEKLVIGVKFAMAMTVCLSAGYYKTHQVMSTEKL